MNWNRVLYVIIIGLVILAAVRFLTPRKSETQTFSGPTASENKDTSVAREDGPGSRRQAVGFEAENVVPGFAAEFIEKKLKSRLVSEQAKNDFMQQAKVELKFPEHYRFQNLDLDFEHITGIYAKTKDVAVSVLAGRLLPTEAELVGFLREKETGIPNLDNRNLTLQGKPVVVPPTPGSGLKAGKYWQGRASNGEGLRLGLVERADGKGSYLFIFTGSEYKLDNSEEFFDDLYLHLRAMPE